MFTRSRCRAPSTTRRAILKRLFRARRLSHARRTRRRQFDQLGARRRADRLLFHERRRARRAASAYFLRRADRQFRRRARRLCRQADGSAGRETRRRDQRQRHSCARACKRALRAARRDANSVAVDGHSGFVQFRTLVVRRERARSGRGPRRFRLARSIRRVRHSGRGARRDPRRIRRASRSAKPRRRTKFAAPGARPAMCSIRIPRPASARRARGSRKIRRRRSSRSRPRIRRSFQTPSSAPSGCVRSRLKILRRDLTRRNNSQFLKMMARESPNLFRRHARAAKN